MDIEINNFMKYRSYNIHFDKKLTLLKGPSGSGKTTIFEAILWCLYGTGRGIDPWYNTTAKTSVIIRFKNYEISRYKRPDRLYFYDTVEDRQYEDKIAQGMINEVFLPEKTWCCSSYIDEDFNNILFSFTSKVRQTIINDIIFSNHNVNDPEADIQILTEDIKSYKDRSKSAKAILDNEKKKFLTWEKLNDAKLTFHEQRNIPNVSIEDIIASISEMRKDLAELNQKQGISEFKRSKLKSIDDELMQSSSSSSLFSSSTLSSIEWQNISNRYKSMIALKNDKLFDPLFKSDILFTEEDILKYRKWESDYNKFKTVLNKHRLKIDTSEEWEKLKTELRTLIKSIDVDYFPLIERKKYLLEQMSKLPNEDSDYSFNEEDLLSAIQYEKNITEIKKYNIDLTKEQIETILKNKDYYPLMLRKRELSEQIMEITSEISTEIIFTEEDYQRVKNDEKILSIIQKNNITSFDFENIDKIKIACNFLVEYPDYSEGNYENKYTQTDYENLSDYLFFKKLWKTSDITKINKMIDDAITYVKYEELIKNYDILFGEDVSEEEYLSVLNEYEAMKNINDTMVCPHCSRNVFLDNGSLKASARTVTSKQKKDLETKLSKLRKAYNDTIKRRELKSKYPNFPDNLKDVAYIGQNNLSEFRKLDFENIPVITQIPNKNITLEEIKKNISYHNRYLELDDVTKNYLNDKNISKKLKIILELNQTDVVTEITTNPKYSSVYIRKCIDYQKIKAEYDSIVIPDDVEYYSGDLRVLKKINLLYRQTEGIDYTLTSSQIKQEIQKHNQYLSYIKYKQEYDLMPNYDDYQNITKEEYEAKSRILKDIENIPFTEVSEYSSKFVEETIKKQQLLDRYQTFSDISSYTEKQIKKNLEISLRREKLLEERTQYLDTEDYTGIITELEDKIKESELNIEGIKLFDEYDSIRDSYDKCNKEFNEIVDELTNVTTLHRLAVNKLHNITDSLISSINVTIKDIVSYIFNDPIDIELSTFRELKNKKLNPEISLKLNYRGGAFTDIKRLSKGEKCRVVLAITLALYQISGSKIFLMDEILAHIEQDVKEKVIEMLKKYTQGKISIMISHDNVSGEYEDEIDLSGISI